MAARLKLGLALRVVEQLAVADHGDGAVFVEDRLLAVTQSDDAEALLDGADAWREQGAGLVGPAMGQRRAHARDLRPIRLPPTFEVDHTCQAAHYYLAKERDAIAGRAWPAFENRAIRESQMQPLGLFYGYSRAAIQGYFGGVNAAIAQKQGRLAELDAKSSPAIAHASHALYIAVI